MPQDLAALRDVATAGETLILVTPFDVVSVAEVTSTDDKDMGAGIDRPGGPLQERPRRGGTSGPWPAGLPAVAQSACWRSTCSMSAPPERTASPRASPARASTPGPTGLAYKGDVANATLDIADNIADLQIALGAGRGAASPSCG